VLDYLSNNDNKTSASPTRSSYAYNKLFALRRKEAGYISLVPEAVMVAVHIKVVGVSSSSSGENVEEGSIERLAVQRLAKDHGVGFSGADEGERRRGGYQV